MAVTHTFVSGKADGADATEVRASDWNDDHVVALDAADITADSTTLVGTGVTVQAVLEELDNGVADHLADTTAAHAATAVSADSTTLVGTGTTVQAVLEELDNGIADHLADTSSAHAASAIAFTPNGSIAATDVQAAIQEVRDEATGGAVATDAIFDAKGDLAVGTGANTASALTVGANDTMLMAASGASTGLKWATTAEVITALTGAVGGLPVVKNLASNFPFATLDVTLQSITGMTLAVGTSQVWRYMLFLEVSAVNTSADVKFAWSGIPAGATMLWGVGASGANAGAGYAVGTGPVVLLTEGTTADAEQTVNGTIGITYWGRLTTAGTSGTLQLQGAENSSDAGQVTVIAGSTLMAWRTA